MSSADATIDLKKPDAKAIAEKCEKNEGLNEDIRVTGSDQLTPFTRVQAKKVECTTAELFIVTKGEGVRGVYVHVARTSDSVVSIATRENNLLYMHT